MAAIINNDRVYLIGSLLFLLFHDDYHGVFYFKVMITMELGIARYTPSIPEYKIFEVKPFQFSL